MVTSTDLLIIILVAVVLLAGFTAWMIKDAGKRVKIHAQEEHQHKKKKHPMNTTHKKPNAKK